MGLLPCTAETQKGKHLFWLCCEESPGHGIPNPFQLLSLLGGTLSKAIRCNVGQAWMRFLELGRAVFVLQAEVGMGRGSQKEKEPETEESVCAIGGINGKHHLWVHPREMLPWNIACSNSLFPVFS